MNRPLLALGVLPLLAACEPEVVDPGRQQIGSVETEDGAAEVWDSTTFFYAQEQSNGDTVMALLFSAAEDLSCADAAQALLFSSTGELDDYDPRPLNIAGSCTMVINDPKWDGSLKATLAEGDKTVEATISLDCFPQGGEWVEGDDGWAYAGDSRKWTARPTSFDLDISGDESGATWTIDMATLEGKPLEELTDYASITGSVSGSGDAAWCSDLASSSLFPG